MWNIIVEKGQPKTAGPSWKTRNLTTARGSPSWQNSLTIELINAII